MKKYRLVIFDLDGTLLDSFPWFVRIVNQTADKHGFRKIEDGDISNMRKKTSREILQALDVPMWKLPLIARDMRELKSAYLNDISLFPRVEPMLAELSAQGKLLAMVSSDSETNVRQSLGPANRFMSAYACGASLFGKAAKFRQVMKELDVASGGVICIGDEIRDSEAAQKANADFGAVTWGYAAASALKRTSPALIFNDPDDVVLKLT